VDDAKRGLTNKRPLQKSAWETATPRKPILLLKSPVCEAKIPQKGGRRRDVWTGIYFFYFHARRFDRLPVA
jgi:hypothetical protein